MSNFDPYSQDSVAPDADLIAFGEVVLHRGFQGIWLPDETTGKNALWDYDPNSDEHKAAIANGKRVFVYYAVQFCQHGATWEFRTDNLANFSDEWKELCKSLADVWGVPVKSKEFADKLRQWDGGSIFAKWQTEIEDYKDKNGIDRKRYIKRVKELYPSLDAAIAAYDASKGINGQVDKVPSGTQVEALPKEQALPFVQSLANQVAKANEGVCDPEKLQEAIDSMPMLGDLTVDDPDVQAIIKATGVPF